MDEVLAALPAGSAVLDLGSGSGSFDVSDLPLTVVRADLMAPRGKAENFVICRASHLPFANQAFKAVVMNHSLEHFEEPARCLSEVGRVLAPGALLYIAIPDASTFTDRVYRWLGRGGGHVNRFTDPLVVVEMVAAATGLRHVGTRMLCTSFSFLNRKNIVSRPPRKLLLFGGGHERFLALMSLVLRSLDRWFHWRTSVYGWALYFGDLANPARGVWSNVCVRCGSGHPSSWLRQIGAVVRRRFLPSIYLCPRCGARNFFTDDWEPRAAG